VKTAEVFFIHYPAWKKVEHFEK